MYPTKPIKFVCEVGRKTWFRTSISAVILKLMVQINYTDSFSVKGTSTFEIYR